MGGSVSTRWAASSKVARRVGQGAVEGLAGTRTGPVPRADGSQARRRRRRGAEGGLRSRQRPPRDGTCPDRCRTPARRRTAARRASPAGGRSGARATAAHRGHGRRHMGAVGGARRLDAGHARRTPAAAPRRRLGCSRSARSDPRSSAGSRCRCALADTSGAGAAGAGPRAATVYAPWLLITAMALTGAGLLTAL